MKNRHEEWGDLLYSRKQYMELTTAVILFPVGPVTETQAPQLPEVSQLLSLNAVPKIPLGKVQVEKEQAPPWTFPP